MNDVPRSKEFDDLYFSQEDGLAETRHVFLDSNGLPEFWEGREAFTVCETGFGTGLNFLALLKLWRNSEVRPAELRYISFEKYPLSAEDIWRYLSHWEELSEELSMMLAGDLPDGVSLELIIGDVNEEVPKLESSVDCWFLDGFKPSSNPEMWSETVFTNMARLSASGAHMATFTAAGFVRRGLGAVGFDVRKIRGFGRKREMLVGVFSS